jgi:hypothetical protein
MSSAGAASLAALSPARAAASRKNGARSRGPKTPEGKARSARNALRHGLCAQSFVVLGDEDLAAFDAFEAALLEELAPQGALQCVLAKRIVAAAWRLERAERIEAELFAQHVWGTTSSGLAMTRDASAAPRSWPRPRSSRPSAAARPSSEDREGLTGKLSSRPRVRVS